MSLLRGFAPIADADSRVLILGSMPSEASLAKGEYYGHPRNAFWPLISAILDEPYNSIYEERKTMLLRHGVALWDVVAECEREGSSDAAIRSVTVNAFPSFFAEHLKIKRVYFNGGKAFDLYKRHVGFEMKGIDYIRLGSTSPAHAVAFERRMEDWKRVADYLREGTHS